MSCPETPSPYHWLSETYETPPGPKTELPLYMPAVNRIFQSCGLLMSAATWPAVSTIRSPISTPLPHAVGFSASAFG